jgi:hypothetical protein
MGKFALFINNDDTDKSSHLRQTPKKQILKSCDRYSEDIFLIKKD